MRYMILTSRHHEGFALWDSKVSDFTAPNSAAGRDVLAEFVAACQKRRMPYGFYYSLLDWRWPEYFRGPQADPEGWARFRAYVHAQVEELCTDYGDLAVLWYDGGWPYTPEDWDSADAQRPRARAAAEHPDQRPVAAARGLRHAGAARHRVGPGPSLGKLHDHEHHLGLLHHRPRVAHAAAADSLPRHRRRGRGATICSTSGPNPTGTSRSSPSSGCAPWAPGCASTASRSTAPNACPTASCASASVGRHHTIKGNTLYLHCWRWPGRGDGAGQPGRHAALGPVPLRRHPHRLRPAPPPHLAAWASGLRARFRSTR